MRPTEGRKIITADYSGCELRILAEMSGDPIFIKSFNAGGDLHSIVAEKVFGKKVSRTENPELRARAKVINFGLAYGMGSQGLAIQVGITPREAENLLARYFRTFPTIYQHLETSASEAIKKGVAVTLGGRKCRLPSPPETAGTRGAELRRFVKNMPIQGTNSDIIKTAMIGISDSFREKHLDAAIINTVHDELVVESSETDALPAAEIVKSRMINAGGRFIKKVPVDVECSIGRYWGDPSVKV